MKFIGECNIVHCDLRAASVSISETGTYKIDNFHLAKVMTDGAYYASSLGEVHPDFSIIKKLKIEETCKTTFPRDTMDERSCYKFSLKDILRLLLYLLKFNLPLLVQEELMNLNYNIKN